MFGTRDPSTLWCPFARVREFSASEKSEPVVNREISGAPDNGAMCLGASCAAWRWDEPATKSVPLMSAKEARELGGPNAEPPCTDVPVNPRRGHCGLAGPLGYLDPIPE